MNKLTLLTCLAVIMIGYTLVSTADVEDAKVAQNHYCHMVTIYKSSKGEQGWPDYKRIFDKVCK